MNHIPDPPIPVEDETEFLAARKWFENLDTESIIDILEHHLGQAELNGIIMAEWEERKEL